MLLATAALAVGACGQPETPTVSARIALGSQIHTIAASLSIHILSPERDDGILLTCASLQVAGPDHIDPTDPRVTLVARESIVLSDITAAATLDDIPPGFYVLFVQANDPAGAEVGNGCNDRDLVVVSGETATVDVVVFPL